MDPVDICHHNSYNIYRKGQNSEIKKSNGDCVSILGIITSWYSLQNPNCEEYEIKNIHSFCSFSSFFIFKFLILLILFDLRLFHISITFRKKTFFEH